jgi:hypothetical protein
MTKPRALRVDDWRAPWLPLPAQLLNAIPDCPSTRLAPLEETSLLAAARRRTRLGDFGDEGFREPLRLLLGDLAADDCLTPLGRLTARAIFGQLLRARLRVEDRLARDPAIASRELPAPIVIVGLPRTGTTHLHNLLSRLPALRFLPLWESVEPVRSPGCPDLRRLRCALRLRQIDYLIPLFRRMHEMQVDLPHEELQLSALTFRSFFFEGSFRLPRYRPWYAAGDHSGAYRYLRRVLLTLQRSGASERWVLKSPQHLDQLRALSSAFPDSKIVRTHRDPVRAVLSLATMLTYTRRVCYRHIDPMAEARSWADRLEQMLRRSLEQAEALPRNRLLDVSYEAFLKDEWATVERVFDFAEVEIDAAGRDAIRAHLNACGLGRRGLFEYRFEDLGLDPGELRERFRFYREHFDLPDEGPPSTEEWGTTS